MPQLLKSILSFFTDDLLTGLFVIAWVAAIAMVHSLSGSAASEALALLVGVLVVLTYGVFRKTK